ncbi:MAG: malto-oligosyltrehalose trehalohydrolase [Actinomycetia bacterium]|nr:malto-oligosyltrehalose trehalohydrolase [Actinomycetes bacterium]
MSPIDARLPGAHVVRGRTRFSVWAPNHDRVQLALDGGESVEMVPRVDGWFDVSLDGERHGVRYRYRVGEQDLADPASRFQPDGVDGPSAVHAPRFEWSDVGWRGRPLHDYVISEVHIGTYTDDGTFDAAIAHLGELVDLGVTAVELMPVAQFPGARNWGYDGVFPYAVQNTYGGPDSLKRFVDAAHRLGLCVVLDVVYNHLGPEGDVLREFGPYFTDRYRTPWGDALNFDGPESDPVRAFFVHNARQWVLEFHIDALRLDAVHAIVDGSAYPFVEQLAAAVHEVAHESGRHVYTIAESAENDARVIREPRQGGIGCDAQWSDDFHHALHALLTGEAAEYYADFGLVSDLSTAFRDGYTFEGRYSRFRRRTFGRSAAGIPGERFVVFAQNHDHIGNRARGERLSALIDTDGLKVAAATVLCSPFVPLLFMGEEYGESAPFPYFVSHSNPALVDAVRRGRQAEFAQFHAADGADGADGAERVPDPQDEATFRMAILDRRQREKEPHAALLDWHRDLLTMRRAVPALAALDPAHTTTEVHEDTRALVVRRRAVPTEAADVAAGEAAEEAVDEAMVVLTFGLDDLDVSIPVALGAGREWRVLLDSHPGRLPAEIGGDAIDLVRPARSVLVLRRAA